MDLQERAVIVAVQLKSSTYPKDRVAALHQALQIVNEDNLIGGTEFLDSLIFLLQERPGPYTAEVFKILARIFTGKNGREFSNIFVDKIGINFIVSTIMDTACDTSSDIKDVLFTLIKYNRVAITAGLISSNQHSVLIEEALTKREIVIELLVQLGKNSNVFRKLLIFNGFIDGLMKVACDKNRSVARCCIKSLAELMNSDISVVSYFFEMRWKEWLDFVLKMHPEYSLKIIYAFSCYPKYRGFLSVFAETLFEIKDIASLFLLSYTESAKDNGFAESLKSSSVTCPCKLNFILGIYSNLVQKTSRYKREAEIGSAEYFGIISNFKVIIDETEMISFLSLIESLPTMPLNTALLFLKTAIAIALQEASFHVFSEDILLFLRELLQNDALSEDLRILIAFWVFLGYIHLRNTSTLMESIFSDFHEVVLPLALKLLTSLTHPSYNSQCEEGNCNRCYFLQLTTPNVIPHFVSLLTQLIWVPASLHSIILSKFALFFLQPQSAPLAFITEEQVNVDSDNNTAVCAPTVGKEAENPSSVNSEDASAGSLSGIYDL